MKKIFVISVVAFLLANIASAIVLGSFQRSFFEDFYQKNETHEQLNMSFEDLMMATDTLLDYIVGENDDLVFNVNVSNRTTQMFNQKEIDHMVDVKALYQTMTMLQWIGYGIFLVSLLFGFILYKKKLFPMLLEASKQATLFLLIIIVGVGLFAIVDFNSFWNAFHELLFTNDLWLLNPSTDRMIVMVPLQFFQQLIVRIVFYWFTSIVLWFVLIKGLALRSEL